jgi:thiamine pyrophosphokinase
MDTVGGHGPESSIGPRGQARGSIDRVDALILADGAVASRSALDGAWPGWDAGIGMVVAADGGARHAATLGVAIDLWVGDGDSLGEPDLAALAEAGIPLERSRPDKDESDTELAILAAIRLGASAIVVVGALAGPRIDHALANIGLLALPELDGRPATIVDAAARIGLIAAPGPDGEPVERRLAGRVGDLVSLLPLGPGVEGVTTDGLGFALRDEPLVTGHTRGLSNVRAAPEARVTLRNGLLLVIESPATL